MTEQLHTAFSRIESEVSSPQSRMQIQCEGDVFRFYTGAYYLQRSRLLARTVGVLCIAAGLGLVWLSPWTLFLAVSGLLILPLAPRLLRPSLLLELDGTRNRLVVVQPTVGAGATVPLEQISTIRTTYDTKGWDSFNTFYAVLADGTEIPFMMLLGTDEPLVENACRLLGRLLSCPATYIGPFGHTTTCYTPS